MYDKLREENVFAGHDKCSWAQPEIEYCGFILGTQGICPPTPESLGGAALAAAQECYGSPRFPGTLRLLPAVRRRLRHGRRHAEVLDAEGAGMGMATRPTARV